ncbi:MAG TPA: peptidase, partial [bacterium]|nr:peptidase [bacterium]
MEATTMILAALAAIILLDLALEDVFRRTGIPDVLVLLVLGLVASQLLEIDTTLLDLVGPIFVEAALV